MDWRRTVLSIALVGGCIWCLGMVQQANSEERGIPSVRQQVSPSESTTPNRGDAETPSTVSDES